MSKAERYDRWRSNYMHITIHTAQTWADNFISELNDTYVEAALRTSHQPPTLPLTATTQAFKAATKRLILLGFNATLTSTPDPPKRRFDNLEKQATTYALAPACCVCVATRVSTLLASFVAHFYLPQWRVTDCFWLFRLHAQIGLWFLCSVAGAIA